MASLLASGLAAGEVLLKHPVSVDSWESCSWGCMLDAEHRLVELLVGAFVAVDASGGAFTSDPRLRRVTFGLVVVGPDLDVLGGHRGTGARAPDSESR